MAWIHFGITFFDTSLIKYQLTDEHFEYLNMGFFQLGSPRLSVSHSHNHEEAHEVGRDDRTYNVLKKSEGKFQNSKRFEHGPNIATMMHAANIMYRKRMESDFEVNLMDIRGTTTTASCERASLSGVKEE
ncbi:hypothetical protein ANCCEY_00777 [Ancylostoma ceylanicum]|uniref:Uncharacterized protein n=1 Tax=Ancylostoma ceylanicum TaxID=53326 RepID=A0A0D6M7E6_9BILA|nr:hypothetical protein ANCCEY_00777 [Ancylostoma ceylanicum]